MAPSRTALPILALCAGAAAFGAAGLTNLLFGAGLPFVLAALLAAAAAALVVYACGHALATRQRDHSSVERLHHLEHVTADLRHELRGVLSPALMVSDRLLAHDDPAIRRAGQAVVRSIERATELIVRNKREIVGTVPEGDPVPPQQTTRPLGTAD